MDITLKSKNLNLSSGHEFIVLLNQNTSKTHGFNAGDEIFLRKDGLDPIVCTLNLTDTIVNEFEIGLCKEVYTKFDIKDGEDITINIFEPSKAISFIEKKFKNHELDYSEIKLIIEDIVNGKLGIIGKTYFSSLSYSPGFTDNEIYLLTKAMAETGSMIKFDGITVDKHSIGGIAGKGITPIVVSIVASCGLKIPNTSSRTITAAVGTSDILESVTNVSLSIEEVKKVVNKTNACLVWGGGLSLAPADDELIRVERVLGIEAYDKFLVSIIAKKVALGINYLVIDIPYGEQCKVSNIEDVAIIRDKFEKLGEKFGLKIKVIERAPLGIDGNAVGINLEMREVLYVLENSELKSKQLELDAVSLAASIFELSGFYNKDDSKQKALEALTSGKALSKFKEIINEQGSIQPDISSSSLNLAMNSITFKSAVSGNIKTINNKKIIDLAKMLECSLDKLAGIYLYKKPGDKIEVGDKAFTLYSSSKDRLEYVIKNFIPKNNLFEII